MPSEEESTVNPIPSSVMIVNESTPLLSQEQYQAGSTITNSQNNRQSLSLWSFNADVTARQKETKGVILLSLSSLFFAIISVLVKYLQTTIPSFEIVFARSAMQLFLGLISCLILGVHPLGKKGIRKWILLRALTSSIALYLFFYGLTKLPLIDATVIFFVGPIFKIIIASSVLNENYSVKDGFYSFICFIGLLFVIKPSVLFHQQMTVEDVPRSIATVAVLVGALMSAMAYVTARKLGQDTHIVVHMVYFGLVASIISLPRLQEFVIPDQLDTIWMLGAIGLVAFLGQTLLNYGLKLAPFGLANIIQAGDVILAFIFGIVLFNEQPGFYTIIGSILVVLMTTMVNIHRWRMLQLRNVALRKRRSKDRLIQQQRER
ncbi:hypothetical protein G6F37_011447 [Rhizopus arrhizus]|nr:hypothetical protein G6F37_011447 [Rhizopus arrhizus]KAG1150696.1 hypothetical protein G6F38_001859 [Rhizopus arrhizus]